MTPSVRADYADVGLLIPSVTHETTSECEWLDFMSTIGRKSTAAMDAVIFVCT